MQSSHFKTVRFLLSLAGSPEVEPEVIISERWESPLTSRPSGNGAEGSTDGSPRGHLSPAPVLGDPEGECPGETTNWHLVTISACPLSNRYSQSHSDGNQRPLLGILAAT